MTAFLQIASRVEAAIGAYNSVQNFTDSAKWKERFNEELVSVHLHGVLNALQFEKEQSPP